MSWDLSIKPELHLVPRAIGDINPGRPAAIWRGPLELCSTCRVGLVSSCGGQNSLYLRSKAWEAKLAGDGRRKLT